MNKKGQFFLIASLIIISIVLGFGVIYNSASASKEDSKSERLANMIKYEAVKVIEYSYVKGQESEISGNLNLLLQKYAESNPDLEINLINEISTSSFEHTTYKKEVKTNPLIITPDSNKKITINIKASDGTNEDGSDKEIVIPYTFDDTIAANDVYIIVKKENKENYNERFIGTA